MKILSLLLFVLIVLSVLKYFKVFDINIYLIIGLFILWIAIAYIIIHFKNKERRTPKPVYITNNLQ